MIELHVICKNNPILRHIAEHNYESGYWPPAENEAASLVGGMLCLHETKADRSYFGGTVEGFRRAAEEHRSEPTRLIFTIMATPDAGGRLWRGSDHAMTWIGGVVED